MPRAMLTIALLLVASALTVLLTGCQDRSTPALSLPHVDTFDRKTIGPKWWSDAPGRWRIEYEPTTRKGRLCVERAKNNPLFLVGRLPRDVVVEFDSICRESEGDAKAEIFTNGRLHATGYVLVLGGWNNRLSIIDRLDEHNRDRKVRRGGAVKNKAHHWKISRIGNTVKWELDGAEYLSYKDRFPLEGGGHDRFAFGNWVAYVCYDNLVVYRPGGQSPLAARKSPAPATPATPVPASRPAMPSVVKPASKALRSQPVKPVTAPKLLRLIRPKRITKPVIRPTIVPRTAPRVLSPAKPTMMRIVPRRAGKTGR